VHFQRRARAGRDPSVPPRSQGPSAPDRPVG
jgi:hypothetical protein